MKKLKNNKNESFNTLTLREMESKEGMEKYMENPLEGMKNHGWGRGECPLLFRALYYVKTKAFV